MTRYVQTTPLESGCKEILVQEHTLIKQTIMLPATNVVSAIYIYILIYILIALNL